MSALVEEVRTRRRPFAPAVARAIREAAGVSQARLAEELGVHPVTVTRWEIGTRHPTGPRLEAYTRLLEQLQDVTNQ